MNTSRVFVDAPHTPAVVVGHVFHGRTRSTRAYQFRHRLYMWLIDLDHIPVQPWYLKPFASFRASDHFGDSRASIKANVVEFLALHGLDIGPRGRVLMMANARMFGFVFDPLTVFWCIEADGALACLLAEVRNTYGERHVYVVPPAEYPARIPKAMYVSPFNDVSGEYEFACQLTHESVGVSITLIRCGDAVLRAAFGGEVRPATTLNILRQLIASPFMSWIVPVLVRVHGVRLAALLARMPRPIHRKQEGV